MKIVAGLTISSCGCGFFFLVTRGCGFKIEEEGEI